MKRVVAQFNWPAHTETQQQKAASQRVLRAGQGKRKVAQ